MKEEEIKMEYDFIMKEFTHQELARMYVLALRREQELRMTLCHVIGSGVNKSVSSMVIDQLVENGKEQL